METGCGLKSESTKTRRETSKADQLGSDFDEMFSYNEAQEEVLRLLISSIEFAKTQDFITHIKDEGLNMHIAIEQLTERKKDLLTECAVVFAGETSAGKSTIINRIIGGKELLPTQVTACTRKICRIGYSHGFSSSSKDCNGKELETSVFLDREELTKKLKESVKTVSPDIVYVDIGMPLPMFQGNVIIVDIPGIGDEDQEEVAQLMMDYIPKALAFVFVLNVANAGGIQQDRLTRVIEHVKDSLKMMPCFCPKDAIFVLNKWDTIRKENDKKECLDTIKEKLHKLWEEIEDSNIKTLAADLYDETHVAMFGEFENILHKVIKKNENRRIKIHLDLLEKHLKECNRVVSTKLHLGGQTTTESKTNLNKARKELVGLENSLKAAKSDLQRTIDNFLSTAAEQLYKFVHTEQFKREILFDIDKITRRGIRKELESRIEEREKIWHRDNIENIFLETFLDIHGERFKKIHEKLHAIKDDMQGIRTSFTDYPKIAAVLASSISLSGTGLLGSLMVSRFFGSGFVATGVAAAGILYGLLTAGLIAFDIPDDIDTICERTFKGITNNFSKEEIRRSMHANYENDFKAIIETFMDGDIKEEIHHLNKSIDTMLNNLDRYRKEEVALLSLKSEICYLMTKLNSAAKMKIRSR